MFFLNCSYLNLEGHAGFAGPCWYRRKVDQNMSIQRGMFCWFNQGQPVNPHGSTWIKCSNPPSLSSSISILLGEIHLHPHVPCLKSSLCLVNHHFWLVVWNMTFMTVHSVTIIPFDFHICQRGRSTTNQIIINNHQPYNNHILAIINSILTTMVGIPPTRSSNQTAASWPPKSRGEPRAHHARARGALAAGW